MVDRRRWPRRKLDRPVQDGEMIDDAPIIRMLSNVVFDLLDQADAYAYVLDTDLRYLYLNHKALVDGYAGLPLEAVIGKSGRDFFPPGTNGSDLDDLEYNDRRVLATGKPIQVYETLLGRVLFSTKWPLCDEDGKVYAVGGVSFDVTAVVGERVRGEGDDAALLVEMTASMSRMTQALMAARAVEKRG